MTQPCYQSMRPYNKWANEQKMAENFHSSFIASEQASFLLFSLAFWSKTFLIIWCLPFYFRWACKESRISSRCLLFSSVSFFSRLFFCCFHLANFCVSFLCCQLWEEYACIFMCMCQTEVKPITFVILFFIEIKQHAFCEYSFFPLLRLRFMGLIYAS